jgi:hypothetical protein
MQHKPRHEKCTTTLGCISHSIKVKLTETCCEDRTGSRQGPEEDENRASSENWSETAYDMVNSVKLKIWVLQEGKTLIVYNEFLE